MNPPWARGLDKFLFFFKSYLCIFQVWKTLFCSRGGSYLASGCVSESIRRGWYLTPFLYFLSNIILLPRFISLPYPQLWGKCLDSHHFLWALRIRWQPYPGACLPPHHHLLPRSSPLLNESKHTVLFSVTSMCQAVSSSELFPLLQLISSLLSRPSPTHPSELSLPVTLL